MRKKIIKTLSVIFFLVAIALIGVYVVFPFFEKKEDLNPKVAEEKMVEEETEQENDTI
jgi:uncharacterized protein YneF (UPF0154 family)